MPSCVVPTQTVPELATLRGWEVGQIKKHYYQSRGITISRAIKTPHSDVPSMIRAKINNAGIDIEKVDRKFYWSVKFVTICYIGNFLAQVIATYQAKNDAERFFECFGVLTFCGMGILKLWSLRGCCGRWFQLLANSEALQHEQEDDQSEVEYETDDEHTDDNFTRHITSYSHECKSVVTGITGLYITTLIIFTLSCFVEYVYWKIMMVESPYPHILPSWSPLERLGFVGYLLTLISEIISATYCVIVHIAFDTTIVSLMIIVTGQFSLLWDYCERIAGKGADCIYSMRRDIRAHHRIVKCHRLHLKLIYMTGELNKLIQNVLGIYFLVATLTLCSVAVNFMSEDLSVMQFMSLIQYMFATLTQLYMLCHFGDRVKSESSVGMGQGPFAAAYWCVRPRLRRELVLLGMGMMRPRLLRAGFFYTLDLPSFVQIVRAAYSYYAVLRK